MDSPPTKVDYTPTVLMERKPIQYSLRTLLELTAVVALGFSLWRWGGEAISRTPEFFVVTALVLLAVGLLMKRWTWILGGIVTSIGLLLALGAHSEQGAGIHWDHEKFLLKIIDSQNRPIEGAIVRISSNSTSASKTKKYISSSDGSVSARILMRYHETGELAFYGPVTKRDGSFYDEIIIEVRAAKYKAHQATLSDLMKRQGLVDLSDEQPILITLSK
jgi:hypothetical protein